MYQQCQSQVRQFPFCSNACTPLRQVFVLSLKSKSRNNPANLDAKPACCGHIGPQYSYVSILNIAKLHCKETVVIDCQQNQQHWQRLPVHVLCLIKLDRDTLLRKLSFRSCDIRESYTRLYSGVRCQQNFCILHSLSIIKFFCTVQFAIYSGLYCKRN